MRLLVVLVSLFIFACAPIAKKPEAQSSVNSAAVVELGGVMVGETVLSGEYLLVTDLLIPVGSRLVIKPGTTIMVRRAELTKIDPEFLSSMTELLVRGTLIIEGTDDAPVVIASEKSTASDDPAWAGLLLDKVQSSAVHHTEISGAEIGVLMIDADIELTDCRLEQNRYGIVIQAGSPLLKRNRISNGEGGLFIWNGATPTLNANVVSNNAEEGVYIDRSSNPKLSGNRAEQNAIGLVSINKPAADGLQLLDNVEAWRALSERQVMQ